jgi:hypothetical protein
MREKFIQGSKAREKWKSTWSRSAERIGTKPKNALRRGGDSDSEVCPWARRGSQHRHDSDLLTWHEVLMPEDEDER